jgi:hypothetical protein
VPRVSKPPSIAIVSPFIDRPCSDARKKAAAISSAATARFMGITAGEEVANRKILQLVPRQRCFHQTWRDADHTDAARSQLRRATAGAHVDAGVCCTVAPKPAQLTTMSSDPKASRAARIAVPT